MFVLEAIFALLTGAFIVYFAWSQFDDTPPLRFLDPIGQHVATKLDGRSFIVHRVSCLDRVKPGIAIVRLAGIGNQLVIPLPAKQYNADGLGCHTMDIMVPLPDEVPAGEYMYLVRYQFTVNPFKVVEAVAPPVQVTVTK